MNPLRRLINLISRLKADAASAKGKLDPSRANALRAEARHLQRKLAKEALLNQCSRAAKQHKAQLILERKGKNGRSMSPELLRRHGINQPI